MAVANPDHRKLNKTLTYMENMSFDSVHEVLTRIPLTINAVTGATERSTAIQGNPSMTLEYDGDGNLTTLSKTIGLIHYFKTFTWTGSRLTAISEWSTELISSISPSKSPSLSPSVSISPSVSLSPSLSPFAFTQSFTLTFLVAFCLTKH